jgi:hypothetical protein
MLMVLPCRRIFVKSCEASAIVLSMPTMVAHFSAKLAKIAREHRPSFFRSKQYFSKSYLHQIALAGAPMVPTT